MEQHNPLVSAMQKINDLSKSKQHTEEEIWSNTDKVANKSISWKLSELDIKLIRGYYVVDGRKADQVLQTPFENYCISKIGADYDLFEIGSMYRPIVVSFEEHLDIKHWLKEYNQAM